MTAHSPTEIAASLTFLSADGTYRCRGCGLHADQCTCKVTHPLWLVLGVPVSLKGAARETNA